MNKIKKCSQCSTNADAVPTAKGGKVNMVCDNCGNGLGVLNNKGVGTLIKRLRIERDMYRTAFKQISSANDKSCNSYTIGVIIDNVLSKVDPIK